MACPFHILNIHSERGVNIGEHVIRQAGPLDCVQGEKNIFEQIEIWYSTDPRENPIRVQVNVGLLKRPLPTNTIL